jgi:hypothetical protein
MSTMRNRASYDLEEQSGRGRSRTRALRTGRISPESRSQGQREGHSRRAASSSGGHTNFAGQDIALCAAHHWTSKVPDSSPCSSLAQLATIAEPMTGTAASWGALSEPSRTLPNCCWYAGWIDECLQLVGMGVRRGMSRAGCDEEVRVEEAAQSDGEVDRGREAGLAVIGNLR